MIRIYLIAAVCLLAIAVSAQEKESYVPEIHGTVRAKYEYQPPIGKGRFAVRNARVGVEGKVIPIIRYKAEIDLSDQGKIKMLDAFVRIMPIKPLKITVGQMRVPFTIDAHRAPHLQYFANRSFIAKQAGNVRDVGAAVGWTFDCAAPVTLEGGMFNGSGLDNQQNFWTSNYNFSFKAQTMIARKFNITVSVQKTNVEDVNIYMYDAGAYFQSDRWHIEAEYLRKYYAHDMFRPVNAVDVFGVYRLPLKKIPSAISFLGRYDYMSDHSKGTKDDQGRLMADDPQRHRITGGVTLSFGKGRLLADLRINYEQYFYRKGAIPAVSEQSKAVAEVMVHF